jgi:hypothetical protein
LLLQDGSDYQVTESWPRPTKTKVTKMKKTYYILGLVSGAILVYSWKLLVKEGVKIGVTVGREIKKVSAATLEDIEDATAEAMQDMADQDQAGRDDEHQDTARRRTRPAN